MSKKFQGRPEINVVNTKSGVDIFLGTLKKVSVHEPYSFGTKGHLPIFVSIGISQKRFLKDSGYEFSFVTLLGYSIVGVPELTGYYFSNPKKTYLEVNLEELWSKDRIKGGPKTIKQIRALKPLIEEVRWVLEKQYFAPTSIQFIMEAGKND